MKVTVKATVESVCVENGRLGDSALFDETFAPLSERMTQDEQICSLALTRIPGLGPTGAFRLVSSLGSATRVFGTPQRAVTTGPRSKRKDHYCVE